MSQIQFHEDEWVGTTGKYIVIDVPLKAIVLKVNKLLKEIASDNSDNPVRLYASNAYTSLKLLLNKLDEEESRDSGVGDKNVIESPSVVGDVILKFMHGLNQWSGTHTELLNRLSVMATREQRLNSDWPRGANALSVRIREIEVLLTEKGIKVHRRRGGNTRSIMLENSLTT